jgi:hypothetical protein
LIVLGVVLNAALVTVLASGGNFTHRTATSSAVSTRTASSSPPATGALPVTVRRRYVRPNANDYDVITSERTGLAQHAQRLLAALERCERRTPDAYGDGLYAFNACVSGPVRENIMRAQFEPQLMRDPMRDLQSGPCLQMAGNLVEDLVGLGEASRQWMSDMEVSPGLHGKNIRSDIIYIRQMSAALISLHITPAWQRACHPRTSETNETRNALTNYLRTRLANRSAAASGA